MHNSSLTTERWVTNFSWALDFTVRESEKEKMKAAAHWQLDTTSHVVFFAVVFFFCWSSQIGASLEHPAWVSSLRARVILISLHPQFQVAETKHKRRA